MPTPSLLIVPSRWKTGNPGKLYSQIPTNGNGDFNVTGVVTGGTSIGTRVNDLGYIERITTSGTPRLDYYTSSGTPGCPALLVEPSGTNLVSRSEEFNDASILKQRSSVSGNTTTAPDGNLTADTLSDITSAFGTHFMRLPDVAAVSGTTYAISVFAKAGTSTRIELSFRANNEGSIGFGETIFDLASGVIVSGTGSIIPLPNNWYRCTSVGTVNASGTSNVFCYLYNSANTKNYVGTNGTNNVFVWGAQVETGSVATSYIPTTTGTVTRAADVISVSGAVSGSIGQASGTIYAEVDIRNAFAGTFISLDIGSGADFLIIGRTSGLAVIVQLRRSNGSVVTIITSSAVALGVHKIALGYTNGDYALYIDGVSAGTSTNSTDYPSAALTRCGLAVTSYNIFNDRIRAAALYTTRLTNADLMLLTMPGNNTYLPQAVWDNYLSRPGNAEVPDCLYTRHADLLDV